MRIVKQRPRRGRTRTVFLLIDGQAEAIAGEHRNLMGPGDLFGEVAFLTGDLRTADVVVRSEHARVLCLSEKTLKTVSEGEPVLAARFFGNLARLLASRMSP